MNKKAINQANKELDALQRHFDAKYASIEREIKKLEQLLATAIAAAR